MKLAAGLVFVGCLVACSEGDSEPPGAGGGVLAGAGGQPGAAGTSAGAAGTSAGTAGNSAGTAGTSAGTAGTSAGTAGTSAGTAGTSAGTAGTSAGAAGTSAGAAGTSSKAPSVAFVTPTNGATLANPVTFKIKAANVDEVEVFADETYSLGPAFDPKKTDTLRYRFNYTGFSRPVHVVGRVAGKEVAKEEITVTIAADSCEDRFFVTHFEANNTAPPGTSLFDPREESLAAIKAYVEKLQTCGAKVTLGNMMSLLLFEGAFRIGAYNTLCSENDYHNMPSGCSVYPESLYSYQFGLGAIHTSNFHPCNDPGWTSKMRGKLLTALTNAGFATGASVVTPSDQAAVSGFCPGKTATAVDHYILGAHDLYGVPKNTTGNHLAGYGKFPFFDPEISISMSLAAIEASCASIGDDRDAIATWGGGAPVYGTPNMQNQIMKPWKDFQATCK